MKKHRRQVKREDREGIEEDDDTIEEGDETENEVDVDESLFPTSADYDDAQEVWETGAEEVARSKPEGAFQAEVLVAEVTRSASSDRLQIHWQLRILAGEFAEQEIDKYDGLDQPQQVAITQQQLQRIGVDTDSITIKTLPAHLLNLVGAKIAIKCTRRGDFYNIYFTKMLGEDVGKPASQQSGTTKSTRRAQKVGKRAF